MLPNRRGVPFPRREGMMTRSSANAGPLWPSDTDALKFPRYPRDMQHRSAGANVGFTKQVEQYLIGNFLLYFLVQFCNFIYSWLLSLISCLVINALLFQK